MKKFIMVLALAAFTTGFAQEKNVNKSEEVRTTKATVKTNKGLETVSKKEKIEARQVIELKNADKKKVNYEVKEQPFVIEYETSFTSGDTNYNFTPDDKGFVLTRENNGNGNEKMMPYGKARETGNEGVFIISTKNKNNFAIGSFDAEGNFIIETYDPKADVIVKEVFVRSKK
ncbi:MAG TPA: hypothetical protein VFM70_12525 [Salinimicrobium sp.]|nr:hypothetical protein [Salinimicrobium sp.]